MHADISKDGFAQIGNAGKRSTPDDFKSDFGKEALHLIEPAGMSRDKVQMPAWMTQQPLPHSAGFMGGVVVGHHMDGQIRRGRAFNVAQELRKFLLPVAGLALREDLPGLDVHGGKQGGGAVAEVIMAGAFRRASGQHRQDTPGTGSSHQAQHERVAERVM